MAGKMLRPWKAALWHGYTQGSKNMVCNQKTLGCFKAMIETSNCKNLHRDDNLEFMIDQKGSYPIPKDETTVVEYYDKVEKFFKHPNVDSNGIVARPLSGECCAEVGFVV
jgi:hypothetical protein